MVETVLPLMTSSREKDLTRLAALEVARRFYWCVDDDSLFALSHALPGIDSPALKIELIKLLTLCRFVPALPALRMCVDDHATDERIQLWFEEVEDELPHRVSTHAQAAIQSLERTALARHHNDRAPQTRKSNRRGRER